MGRIKLEFTTTACCRPEILKRTYASFSKNIEGVDFSSSTLYINIDSFSHLDQSINQELVEECLSVARSFFGTVIYNAPEKPNFSNAVKWCWSQDFKNEFFFHLEDDWECTKKININKMFDLFKKKPNIVAVNLRAYSKLTNRLCLSPSLWRRSYAKKMSGILVENYNPEKQIRGKRNGGKNLLGKEVGIFNSIHFPNKIIIRDIGRSWMVKNKLKKKNKGGGRFKNWEVKKPK